MSMQHVRALSLFALTLSAPGLASTVLKADLATLARTADAVVRGTVTGMESRWSGDRMRIVTDVRLQVVETLKGTADRQLTVLQPGGVVGDIGQRVDGLATFEQGEEVVLFLERRGSRYVVSGMAQGKFRVERSSDGKLAFAVPSRAGDTLYLDPVTRRPTQPELKTLTLDELRGQLRQLGVIPKATP